MKNKSGGKKNDSAKVQMDLLPFESLEEVAKVLTFGVKKYGRFNWKKGISYSRLIAAATRHIGQYNDGQDYDDETKTHHAANAACNLLFLIWMHNNRKDLDDRYKPDGKKAKGKKRK